MLADKFNELSMTVENKQQIVANEIIGYFREQIESPKFIETLTSYMERYPDFAKKRAMTLIVEFWRYQSGCSDTNFRAGLIIWNNPENPTGWDSEKYKGINLFDIQEKVGSAIWWIFKNRLEAEGFSVTSKRTDSWLKNYRQEVMIRW